MTTKTVLLLFFSILFALPSFAQDQEVENYQFLINCMPGMKRKIKANEIMLDKSEKYLIVNYENKPTFIVVYEFGLFQPVATFRLSNWVEFSGAYIDHAKNQLYLKEGRYSNEYYRLDINSGEQDLVECELTPVGCPVIEPKQGDKELYSANKQYYITINKRNKREVKVYVKK